MSIGFNKNKTDTVQNADVETDDVIDDLRDDDDENEGAVKAPHFDVKVIVLAVVLVVIVLACLVFWKSSDGADDVSDAAVVTDEGTDASTDTGMDTGADTGLGEEQSNQTSVDGEGTGNGVYDENGNTIDPNGINPGVPDYEHSTNNTTTAKVFDANDFVKDINGLDVAAIYHEASLEYVIDYVSYEAHRGITDTGMELYWLDVDYNGLKYRMQVPFYYFKDLKERGVCRVEIEIVHTIDGGKIISYMHIVSEDYTGD